MIDRIRRGLLSPIGLIAVPLVGALVLAGWLLWARQDPARQGGYCTNATIAGEQILRQAETVLAAPDARPDDIIDIVQAAHDIDVDRFRAHTPAAVRADIEMLAVELPALDARRDRARATGELAPPAPPGVAAALGRVLADYLHRCHDISR